MPCEDFEIFEDPAEDEALHLPEVSPNLEEAALKERDPNVFTAQKQPMRQEDFEKLKAVIEKCKRCGSLITSCGEQKDMFGESHRVWECHHCGEA